MHVLPRLTQDGQREYQKCNTKQEVADVTVLLLVDEDDTHEECWIGQAADVERHTSGHDPCRQRGSNVGTHDD